LYVCLINFNMFIANKKNRLDTSNWYLLTFSPFTFWSNNEKLYKWIEKDSEN